MIKEVFRSDNITVYRYGNRETMVYGDGADWYAQCTNVTNYVKRKWYSNRRLAEEQAKNMVIQCVI
jgi:hypothetical protein